MTKPNDANRLAVTYRDTRRAARRLLSPRRGRMLRRVLLLVLVTALSIWAWGELTADLAPDQRAVAFLFLLAVGLWITEAVPAFAVGLLIMGYLVFALGTTLIHPEPWDVRPSSPRLASPRLASPRLA